MELKLSKYKTLLVGLIVFSMIMFFVKKHRAIVDEDIKNNRVESICKVFFVKTGRQSSTIKFYYYFYQNRYESSSPIDASGSEYINKFYKVEFSSIHPNYSKIFLNQEVTDTAEILKAGFSSKDLKKMTPR